MGPVRIGLLGPVEVLDDEGGVVEVPGVRLRALLTALALNPGRLVSTAQLVDAVWDDEPPATAGNSLQALVSRLRRALPTGLIESAPAGYRLVLSPDDVDVTRFERLVAAGRAQMSADPAVAAATLAEGLGLWRGPALFDVASQQAFQAPIVRLEELRLTAIEDRAEVELRLGRAADVITELTTLAAEHPLRERPIGTLMRALSESGRPAEALTIFERTRTALADELGADPSPELSALHTAILRGEIGPPTAPAPTPDGGRRTNLPAALTSFVGRDVDVTRVRELVNSYRLVTLIGAGGSGKTRLAVETARTMLGQMHDGVWLVELAPVADGAAAASAVMAAMGVREQPRSDRARSDDGTARLVAALRDREALVVLDNCEHLVDAAAALVDRLLSECARLRIVATSREPLGITGEAVRPVGPLGLPEADTVSDVRELMSYDSVRLLADRAGVAAPGFSITDREAPGVARICRALDGMPLAIELAAARLRTMSVGQLADRLDDRFRLLTGGSRTALPRHQTLRAVVDWSWELLSDAERALLRRLSVFAGGATQEAAEIVCSAAAPVGMDDVLDLLTSLTDKSLLVAREDDSGETRFRMLETIRAYGLERLDEAGERDDVQRAYARYVVELVEEAAPHLRRAEQLVWLGRLRSEHDNVNAVLRGAIANHDAQLAVRLAAAAGWYWWLGGNKGEGIQLTTEALGVPGEVDAETRAEASAMIAYFTTAGLGDLHQAEPWLRQTQELAEDIVRPSPLVRFVVTMGAAMLSADRPGALITDKVQPLIDDEDPWVRGATRLSRTRMLPLEERRADMERALTEFRSIGERWGISYTLGTLAELAAKRGDLTQALDYAREAIDVITEIGDVEDLVFMHVRQAQLRWLVGDVDGAAAATALAEREAAGVGWPDALAIVAFLKASLARWSDDTTVARYELLRAEDLLRHSGPDPVFRAMILDSHGYLDAGEDDLDMAGARRAEALDIAVASQDMDLVSQVLLGIADQAVRRGQAREAVRLLAASENSGGSSVLYGPDCARVTGLARATLGEPEFAKLLEQARREFAGGRRGELVRTEVVRELTASTLSP